MSVVCDGAGSASHGRQGAIITCRTLTQAARQHLRQNAHLPTVQTLTSWADETRHRIHRAAKARGLQPRDFACTLLCAISNGQDTLVGHIGDGGIVARLADSGTWQALSWPDHGEYASTTRFVTDDPPALLRTHITRQPIDALALFSDGLERLVLDMATRTPFARFFSAMATPLLSQTGTEHTGKDTGNGNPDRTAQTHPPHAAADDKPPCTGRRHTLSRQLKAYLDSEAINTRTDDDKTLVLAVLNPSGKD